MYFYHYTSIKAAKDIIVKGEIRPSDAAIGDAAYGDGVYLTTLKPDLGKTTIMNNNWGGAARDKKVEAYFELLMPASKVVRAEDQSQRDIQVHKGGLKLSDYKWVLKNWDRDLLVTQYFKITSTKMGRVYLGDA